MQAKCKHCVVLLTSVVCDQASCGNFKPFTTDDSPTMRVKLAYTCSKILREAMSIHEHEIAYDDSGVVLLGSGLYTFPSAFARKHRLTYSQQELYQVANSMGATHHLLIPDHPPACGRRIYTQQHTTGHFKCKRPKHRNEHVAFAIDKSLRVNVIWHDGCIGDAPAGAIQADANWKKEV